MERLLLFHWVTHGETHMVPGGTADVESGGSTFTMKTSHVTVRRFLVDHPGLFVLMGIEVAARSLSSPPPHT